MELPLPLDKLEVLDDAPYGKSHAVSVLSVCDIKRCSTALHFAREELEVHPAGCDEKGGIIDAADERIEPVVLLARDCECSATGHSPHTPTTTTFHYVARFFADGAIKPRMSWIIISSFLSSISRQGHLTRSSRNKES